ncbi:MAG: DUF3500 domain-containing protein [Nitrospinae bacterium]|nr:DUF3500 domain-containing protein [Nitrospinota bacterium]
MSNRNPKRRILKYSLGVAVTILAIGIFSFQYPKLITQIVFGANTSPIELALRGSYGAREGDKKTAAIASAATAFLASLNDAQKKAAMFAFSDNAQRSNWSNFPEGMFPRGGLKLGEITEAQRANLDNLLAEFMSEKGVRNIGYQLAAADTLRSSSFMRYGSEFYSVAFLGEPSANQPWMFQFGGHHLAINITVYGSDVSFSPMLTGGSPLHLRYEGREIFITGEETTAARTFLDSLDSDQKKLAVRGEQSIDLQSGPGEYGTVLAPEGIKGSDLTDTQKGLLLDVIAARLGFMNADDYAAKMTTVKAEIDDTHFGWWGPQGVQGAAYFRVTGPSIVLEYAPQDGGSATGHAHNIYRNPRNDYGSAWIGTGR